MKLEKEQAQQAARDRELLELDLSEVELQHLSGPDDFSHGWTFVGLGLLVAGVVWGVMKFHVGKGW